MSLTYCRVLSNLLFCVALADVTWAQGTRATITGFVKDPVGAAVPGADMSLRSLGTSAVTKTITGTDGSYTFPNVVAGGYDLTVAAKGFHEHIQRAITVNLDQDMHLDIALEIGSLAEVVEVSSNASP